MTAAPNLTNPRDTTTITLALAIGLCIGAAAPARGVEPGPVVRTGPYLGEPLPGDTPIRFAPEILSSSVGVHSPPSFTPDGDMFVWSPMTLGDTSYVASQTDDVWTVASLDLGTRLGVGDPTFSPDGRRIYFTSFQDTPAHPTNRERIWYADTANPTEPVLVEGGVISHRTHWSCSVTREYDLYFTSENGESSDILVSRWNGVAHDEPEPLPAVINSASDETTPFVAPDESYLLFTRRGTDTENSDLFIARRGTDGDWGAPTRLPDGVNSKAHDLCPSVSPDSKYLFFVSGRGEFMEPYWVRAEAAGLASDR